MAKQGQGQRGAGDASESDSEFEALLKSMARTPQALIPETTLVEGRFRVLRALGQGGMGAVYEAFDEQRGQTVALKTLSRCDPQSLYRLKHEFRALSDVAHPNLVALHEFFCDPNAWFFTMDLLRGRDFCSFVRETGDLELGQTRRANERTFDEPRLRSALSQLIQGVCALHEAGKLHCDIKPANVIVGDDGHLRILDFGLVSDAGEESAGQTLGPEWAGTPGYMAPEQMLAQETTAASDFYAVGVMLYEAMNGCLPFKRSTSIGPPAGMRREVHMPHHLATGTTADLAQLCIELLAFEAEARPSRRRLLEYAGDAVRASAPSMPEHAPANPFVGRSNELDQLLSLRLRLEPAKPEAVLIRGPSGIGKTRLAREFLAVCRKDGDSVVLEGRCYERESLPYNAFDSLIDALSRYLRKLPAVRAASVMPRDARLLADLFPVLERVEVIQASPPLSRARASAAREPLEHRRRAFEALRELLSRISDAATLVLCIDDLQWADADSMQLLQALVTAPDAPTMLVLGLYREDDEQPPAQIEQLCERQGVPLSDIRLLPLSAPAVRELVAERLDDANADRIVAESGGNPFFIGELVAAAADQGQDRVRGLHEVILQRADGLSKDMRKLLDILSVAGQPIELGIALQAADLEAGGQAVITEMRNERWLRLDPTGTTQSIEIYHDRIRRALLETLGAGQRRSIHGTLASCYEARLGTQHEVTALHWLEAGRPDRAAEGLASAAELAEEGLAFANAARLYRLALDHGRFDGRRRTELLVCMAEALSRAGRAAEAAEAYLDAAAEVPANGGTLPWRRQATRLLLASGSLERGTEVLKSVLSDVGLAYPEGAAEAQAWLEDARRRLAARNFGLGSDPNRPPQAKGAQQDDCAKADTCWAACPALGSYDFVRSAYFAACGLEHALGTSDARRTCRAMTMYATSLASGGDAPLAHRLAERAQHLAQEIGDVSVSAEVELLMGQLSLFAGDFVPSLAACDRALGIFRRHNVGASLEVNICSMFANMSLHMLGRLDELVKRSRKQLQEAQDHGHVHAEASVRVLGVALGHLADDDVEMARKQGQISARLWPQDQFHGERFKVFRLQAWCDLYEGQGATAWERFNEARAEARESHLLSSRYWRFWWFDLAAAVALTAAARSQDETRRATLLADARESMVELEGMEPKYAEPQLLLYRAATAHLEGNREAALDGLRVLCGLPHPIVAACAQRKLGSLHGGPEGEALTDLGTRTLLNWVKSPDRWTTWMLPGFG